MEHKSILTRTNNQVIQPHGITVGQNESLMKVPYGTKLIIPVEAIHYDDSLYTDPKTFKPFRFVEPSAVGNIMDSLGSTPANKIKTPPTHNTQKENIKQKSGSTIDESFLGFGFGLHACPGRFFAINEVKIFIATMVLNYDIQPMKTRPKMTPLIWLNVPLFNDLRVKVRRRAVVLE